MSYFISVNNARRGPFPPERLVAEGLSRDSMVWCEGMPQWERADRVPALQSIVASLPPLAPADSPAPGPAYAAPGYPSPPQYATPISYPAGNPRDKKLVAGLCGIFLGTFGVHKFIMGYTSAGVIMLCITVFTCFLAAPIMHVIGLIEGIIYLAASDDDFYRKYMERRTEWF